MWESLATSDRSDRVLHGAAKLLNVVVGVIALPVWLLGQGLRDPLRRLLARLDAEPPPLPMAQPRERSMDALMTDLEAIPHNLRRSDGAMVRKGLADISSFVLAQHREAANLGYAYPSQFSDHVLQGADDEHIAATVGLQGAPARPGLIVVHGLFSSRRFDYVRQIAIRAYYEWGFNVLALDLRSFGLTNLTSQAPTTVGWKEGEDVVAAGRYLKQLGATTVGALGISLGGSAVLGACHAEDAADTLEGGILAVSPPADVKAMASRLSRRVPLSHPAYALNRGFWAMLTSRIREAGWEGIEDFLDPLERVSAPYYDVEAEELWRRASAREHIAGARVPVLVLHPDDDQVIPVEHARMLEEAARDNDLVRVWTLPGGGHGAIDAVDGAWFYAVARGFFERWAGYGARDDAAGDGDRPVKLIYSAAR
jgi:predicted alpha/beta-fold hydrolase